MIINSRNEWDPLELCVVGTATQANWPTNDPVFRLESEKTTWKDTPVPRGPVPQWIIDETNEDLAQLVSTLEDLGVEVRRPVDIDFQALDGMYNYCPRDRLLVFGNTIVDPAMMYPCRDLELQAYYEIVDKSEKYLHMPRNVGMTMDAANVLRLDDAMVYLESASGNRAAGEWLAEQFPDIDIYGCDFYSGVHIDSTIVPLRPGLVMLNASRVTEENCPRVFESWEKIWIDDVVPARFHEYPYASKWIALNMLVVDPSTVIVDRHQAGIIKRLEEKKFTVIPLELRHSRTLGGGFHCVTLDLRRRHV